MKIKAIVSILTITIAFHSAKSDERVEGFLVIDQLNYPGTYLYSGETPLAALRVHVPNGHLDIGDQYSEAPDLGLRVYSSGIERMRITPDGNIGIGTSVPSSTRLRVVGTSGEVLKVDDGANAIIRAKHDGTVTFEKGVVGIGTASPDLAYKLSVNGTIRAKEVVVDTGWSDFVFEDTYRLRPLDEVRSHIEEHGHLPDVPSAATVEAEGLSVGEAQMIMMQKIEELTLYVIELNRKNSALERQLAELENQLSRQNAGYSSE